MSDADRTRSLDRDRVLARLFAACVLGRFDVVRALRRGCAPGEPDRRWRETVLQVHVFAGVPRQVETYAVLAECGGLGELEPGESTEVAAAGAQGGQGAPGAAEVARASAASTRARGQALFDRIYERQADGVRRMLVTSHPDFAEWVLGHAYGRVLTRDGLDARTRELLACAALAALGQDRQLASHARGAVRCGADVTDVHATLDAIADMVEPERLLDARRVVDRFAGGASDPG